MSEPRAICRGCGAEQPYGRIRCDQCGKPLVFPASFVCPHCGAESFNLKDIVERYCGRCQVFVDDRQKNQRQREREEKQFAYHREAAFKPPWQGTDAYGKKAETPEERLEREARERAAARLDPRQTSLFP
jgi:hypothetical protein